MTRKNWSIVAAVLVVGLVTAACADTAGAADPAPVTFDIALIEIKGSTDGIPAPEVDPISLSLGYRYKAPGVLDPENPNKWEVSTYLFAPGAMSVVEGDTVTLRMFGVNGDEHDVWVEAPDGSVAVANLMVNRGREYTTTFEATQTGHYTLWCTTHAPTMTADILSIGG